MQLGLWLWASIVQDLTHMHKLQSPLKINVSLLVYLVMDKHRVFFCRDVTGKRFWNKKTTHFYKLDRFGEIRVLFVIRDDARAHSPSGDLNVDARLIDSGQLHPLQVSQTPEQDLQTTLGLEMESICSSFYANEMRCKLKAKIKLVK